MGPDPGLLHTSVGLAPSPIQAAIVPIDRACLKPAMGQNAGVANISAAIFGDWNREVAKLARCDDHRVVPEDLAAALNNLDPSDNCTIFVYSSKQKPITVGEWKTASWPEEDIRTYLSLLGKLRTRTSCYFSWTACRQPTLCTEKWREF